MEAILIRGGTIYVNKWRQYCLVREIARFSERHVTRFRPITCTHFEMRYNNYCCHGDAYYTVIQVSEDELVQVNVAVGSVDDVCHFSVIGCQVL